MFLLKLLQQITYPSVFIGLVFLLGILFRKKNIGKFFLILSFIIYLGFSSTPIADQIISPLENKYSQIQAENFKNTQTVVLLLGGKEGSQIRSSEVLRLNEQIDKPLKVIISGSRPFHPEIKAAQKVKNYLIERGMKSENILIEAKSRNTYESAKIASSMVEDKKFFLVTSSYHMPRSIYLFEQFKSTPIPAPADFKIERDYDLMDFFPKANNLEKTDIAFHEYFGLMYYKIFKF